MATTSITIRMDESLKKQAEMLFDDLGMNMTTAFTVFAKAAVRYQKIPFELASDPFFADANMNRLRKAIADVSSGESKLTRHEIIEADDD
ncbi:MAG: type II toxin-antitoxin system RelB/DinJ family antitoxin [Oscillospiraceae bacterium]|jgi:DNA-damage-inducible protein J|nr:type II toxin-antitoxin system RelB/DinJ family antitoxin [Oscillospiraceae bacterium]